MGLSASSLRLAMLTARKSNLEFEAQQINQQRMNLSNQSAAIYNDMLSMSVPTPPNANEFTKEVYTFNKGNGVSQLLSTTRNSSGPYDYDVLYKTPKTEDVLMKKQLNNVGFKYNNDQMTANIDGVDYALTLNGNEDKLNDYIKTQKTYENIKNVESQMQSLWSLSPDKELSASQMKQYFETLGLSTYETPTRTQVQNVETMDDAFQSVYYSGYDYHEENVEFTYDSDTPPIELDLSQKTLLKNTGKGTLMQGEDNKHYTYEILWKDSSSPTSTIKYPLTYNISQDDEGHWSWTLEDVSGDALKAFGIEHNQKEEYGVQNGSEFVEITSSNPYEAADGIKFIKIAKNRDGGFDISYKAESVGLDIDIKDYEFINYFTKNLDGIKFNSGGKKDDCSYFKDLDSDIQVTFYSDGKMVISGGEDTQKESLKNEFDGDWLKAQDGSYFRYYQKDGEAEIDKKIKEKEEIDKKIKEKDYFGEEKPNDRIEITLNELPEEIIKQVKDVYTYNDESVSIGDNQSVEVAGKYTIQQQNNGNFQLSGSGLPDGVEPVTDDVHQNYSGSSTSSNITFKVTDKGANSSPQYSITATFKAWVKKGVEANNDDKQDGYSYDTKNHTVSLTTPAGVVAQMLLRNQNNNRNENDKNITVNEMLAFYEAILEQFEFFGTSTAYKTKLDTARENYISTIDAKGVETPGENEVIYNFIDQNGNEAYLYVPLSCVNTNGQIDSTYAYMLETSYIEGQTETISQKANIIYDENGRIAKICFDDGTVVMPEITVEQDDEAYEAAMVKYDFERAKYEKALSDCNTKTQIIQEQDKKLELQLKSIDTEHTAIQTELEAVKKF